MSKDLQRIVRSNDKAINEARGPLAKLFRKILFDTKMDQIKVEKLMRQYLDNPLNNIPRDNKIRSSERGNLIKEISRPNMTWKVFMKGLRFLSPVAVRFEVHLTWRNQPGPGGTSTTIHGINVDIGELREIDGGSDQG